MALDNIKLRDSDLIARLDQGSTACYFKNYFWNHEFF